MVARVIHQPLCIGLVAILAGCGSTTTADPAASTGKGDLTGSAKPETSQTTSEAPKAPLANPATSKALQHAKNAGKVNLPPDNPNRVNQLKDLKKVDLKVANQIVHAWIMDNESKRAEGMMFLKDADVKEDQGMIFLFPAIQPAQDHSFWMHDCPMGLDIVYISKDRKVLNVGDGEPESDDKVLPKGDYQYVLELKRGWAKRHGLKPENTLGIPPSLKTNQ